MVERLCVSVHQIFFTRSSIDGHFGCVRILATVNNAALNTEMYISFRISFHFLQVNIQKITESYAGSIFIFLETFILFPIVAIPNEIPPILIKVYLLSS